MELGDIFDLKGQPKIRLKGELKTRAPATSLTGDESSKQEAVKEGLRQAKAGEFVDAPDVEAKDPYLDLDIATCAKEAAHAHDAFAAAKAAYDMERSGLQEEVDRKLATLKKIMVEAGEARAEAVAALRSAMGRDKITTIPMTDRPDIRIRPIKGARKGITRKWLMDPDNLPIKAYEEALDGNASIKTGEEFASKVWESQPKSEDSESVVIPDPYEDEPDRT